MAPVDRREQHRQQRMRGAGSSSVQASFGFNFGALGARPNKQFSLPPQPSSSRTPVQKSPRGVNGLAQRHRSASVQRSSSSTRKTTPRDRTSTPQLGKRKWGSPSAQPGVDQDEEDELSPDREDIVHSIEKSRRVIGTVSPIPQEPDEGPDELSILDQDVSTVPKSVLDASIIINITPESGLAKKRTSSNRVAQKTPIADRMSSMSSTSRQSVSRTSKSTDAQPITPGLQPNGHNRLSSASRSGAETKTPGEVQDEENSEDELSPYRMNGTSPRVIAREELVPSMHPQDDPMDVDELSSPLQSTPVQGKSAARSQQSPTGQGTVSQPAKRGRPRQVVEDQEDDAAETAVPTKPAQRGRPRKALEAKHPALKATSTLRSFNKRNAKTASAEDEPEDEQIDELSPETDRVAERPGISGKRKHKAIEISDAEEDSGEYDDQEPEEEVGSISRPVAKRSPPKQLQPAKPSNEKPLRKRHKFLGPKHAISVMRIKGSSVRGITVADTTRAILEECIDQHIIRINQRVQNSSNPAHRKQMRSERNISLSFKESLIEKLLDLQDANDVLSTNTKKTKLFRRGNVSLRQEILTLQNNRQEIALEHDKVQAEYEAKKEKFDLRDALSANMFSIETAIQNGRDRARMLRREDEGPEMPLGMLLETVGKDVGSVGGGLLSSVKNFNGILERAAQWLEGRI